MTTFLLIRHGAHQLGGGTIAGRMPGVHLSTQGKAQVQLLAERLSLLPIQALYSSPVERTRETAAALSECLRLPVQIREPLAEVGFGEWSGRSLDQLRGLPLFQQWNAFRSGTRIPGGELMLETQCRVVLEMLRLRELHPQECVALVSHGDVIKAAVAYFLGVPLDLFSRIEIGLASVSVISLGSLGPWVLCVNHSGETLPMPPPPLPSAPGAA